MKPKSSDAAVATQTRRATEPPDFPGVRGTLNAIYRGGPILVAAVDDSLNAKLTNSDAPEAAQGLGATLGCQHADPLTGMCCTAEACESCVVRRAVGETIEGGVVHNQLEVALPGPEGEQWFLMSTSRLGPGPEGGALLCSEDITRRKNAEALLLARERQLRLTFELAPVGLATVTADGVWLRVNRALANKLGAAPHEIPGTPVRSWVEGNPHRFDRFVREVFATESSGVQREFTLRGAGGYVFDALCTGSFTPTGRRESAQLIMAVEDLTEKRRQEHERSKTQRLEALGVLAGGLAHDFNNMLMGIVANLSLAQELHADGEAINDLLAETKRAAFETRGITEQLLTFAKGGAPVRKPVSTATFVRDVVSFVSHGITARCHVEAAPNLPTLMADPGQLQQVMSNMLLNADQAMGGVGDIRVKVGVAGTGASRPQLIRIAIHDEGPGIPSDILPRIFDPYFSTRQEGTGLGLSVSHSIVSRHGGRIDVDSAPAQGTTFSVYLPASEEPSGRPASRHLTLSAPRRLLLMDDDDSILGVVKKLLERVGFEVTTCTSGAAAIAAYRAATQDNRPYDVVILDLIVPDGMGGEEVVGELRQLDPNVRAIVASGFSSRPVMANYKDYGFVGVLQKPFLIEDMMTLVLKIAEDPAPETPPPVN